MTTTDPVGKVSGPAGAEQGALRFPADFRWGTATSSFQIEGATTAGGRGPSIWDTFALTHGKVDGGDTGDPACEHYHRYREDVALMRRIGARTYRFSVAWPRIQADGTGQANPAGLDFYDRLVDELLAAGIEPMATLYHWDLPQALQDRGGWVARDTAYRFADYAALVHAHLGDRVPEWTTLNEPFCAAFLGYCNGVHAPGLTDPGAALVAGHNLLLAHGLGTAAMRAEARPEHRFSLVLNFSTVRVEGTSAIHRAAARKVDGLQNRFFLDPVLHGRYPADVLEDVAHLGALEPAIQDGDLELISAKLDWLGVNYYTPTRIVPAADPLAPTTGALPGLRGVEFLPPRGPLTATGWEQEPAALTDLLRWLGTQAPGLPLLVTENGSAFPDEVGADGQVHDHERVKYLVEHLRAVHAAIEAGVDVRGYLAWSLLDNFEWAYGYDKRFGLVHVDFATQRRTLKDSALTYAKIVAANSV